MTHHLNRRSTTTISGAEPPQVSQRPRAEEEILRAEAPSAPSASLPSRGETPMRFWRRRAMTMSPRQHPADRMRSRRA